VNLSFLLEPGLLVTLLALWLVVALLVAPLETLGWWAGWFEGDDEMPPELEPAATETEPEGTEAYLVYLTGISGVSGDFFLDEENELLDVLDEMLPTVTVVKDVYPYSVRNQALTGQRVFAWFWRFALRMKLSGKGLRRFVGFLINIRNAFQVAVSADQRYGPIYNTGFARLIVAQLVAHGYQRGSGRPVYLLGYSGGGQIAVGVVPYLKRMIDAPITVISLGGVMGGDPGAADAEHIYHLYGRRDGVQRIGWVLSPSRWHISNLDVLPLSRWNVARRSGKITFTYMGNVKHNGRAGYLDKSAYLMAPDYGNLHVTAETIARIVTTGRAMSPPLARVAATGATLSPHTLNTKGPVG
jgi:hypothetical protein